MKYLVSILRIFVLVAVVLAIANFSDVKKTKAAVNCSNINTTMTLDNSCENQDVTISGTGVIVTVSGTHTFNNLTITNGANLTHGDFVSGELLSSAKKVDLTITNDLILKSGGKIDVSGKGYVGGNGTISPGDGEIGVNGGKKAFSVSDNFSVACGGGGGFQGSGGSGGSSCTSKGAGGAAGSIPTDSHSLPVGSGGGGAFKSTMHSQGIGVKGGDGGGRIYLNVSKSIQILGDSSYIRSNGEAGTGANFGNNGVSASGGGAGGSIWIDTSKITYYYNVDYSSNTISVDHGSSGGSSSDGGAGQIKLNSNSCSGFNNCLINTANVTNIYSKGGGAGRGVSPSDWVSGGSGGGGFIHLNATAAEYSCYLATNGGIPASCEDKDVVIDNATVTADTVQVAGDTKRHFTSLTIKNNGVLTHDAPIPTTDFSTSANAPNPLTPAGQLKKVDLAITGDVTLESGGKIDVDGKGYPSYELYPVPDVGALGFGPGAGRRGTCTDDRKCASGGGYGGEGGSGDGGSPPLGGGTYGSSFEPDGFGSGAGPASYGTDSIGGGGKIKIIANSILIKDSSSKITANGADQLGSSSESPGGASGGSIWLSANTINTPAVSTILDGCGTATILNYALAGKGITCSPRGEDADMGTLMINGIFKANGSPSTPDAPSYTNIFANGGNIGRDGGAGGGGRIAIGPGPTPTLSATLSASGTFKTGDPTTLTAAPTPDSTATGTINYTFWWNCTNSSTIVSIVSADPACGIPTVESAGSFGAKFDGITDNPKTVQHTYITGSYTAKVIIERNGVSATITTPITVTGPTIKSKKIEVTVTWKEGTQNKTVKLYDVLRSVVTVP